MEACNSSCEYVGLLSVANWSRTSAASNYELLLKGQEHPTRGRRHGATMLSRTVAVAVGCRHFTCQELERKTDGMLKRRLNEEAMLRVCKHRRQAELFAVWHTLPVAPTTEAAKALNSQTRRNQQAASQVRMQLFGSSVPSNCRKALVSLVRVTL